MTVLQVQGAIGRTNILRRLLEATAGASTEDQTPVPVPVPAKPARTSKEPAKPVLVGRIINRNRAGELHTPGTVLERPDGRHYRVMENGSVRSVELVREGCAAYRKLSRKEKKAEKRARHRQPGGGERRTW